MQKTYTVLCLYKFNVKKFVWLFITSQTFEKNCTGFISYICHIFICNPYLSATKNQLNTGSIPVNGFILKTIFKIRKCLIVNLFATNVMSELNLFATSKKAYKIGENK